jgi:PAS domain S-box-containing protein/putative nucleotidyltransferase with HDIG domain
VSARDTTEQQAMAERFRRSDEWYRALIQNTSDVVMVVDATGIIGYVSPSMVRVLGYDPAELIGRNAFDLVHPDDIEAALDALTRAAATEEVQPPASYRVRSASGTWRWIESTGSNLLADPAVEGIVMNSRDVTAQRESVAELADVNRTLRTLTAADAAVVHAGSEQELLEQMCRVLVEVGMYALAWIAIPRPSGTGFELPVAVWGKAEGFHARLLAASPGGVVEGGPATAAATTGVTQVVHDFATWPEATPLRELSLEYGFRSQLGLPLAIADGVTGVLAIHSTEPDSFDLEEIATLEQLAADLSYGIGALRTRVERTRYEGRLERNVDTMVETVTAAVEARDPYTAGHQRRVAELAVAIARDLGLDDHEIAGIRVAASIHDIGKIGIPAEILSRPGALSEPELELVKQHAQAGYDIVRGIDFPWPVAQMILQHHERMDGSGYPNGLVGADLLIGARVMAVADTVEAMASHRPYRPGRGIDETLHQLELDRGTLFDAAVVDACLALFRDGRFALKVS